MSGTRSRTAALRAVLVVLLLGACGGSAALPAEITAAPQTTAAGPTTPPTEPCENDGRAELATYPPLEPLPPAGSMPEGSTMAEIVRDGRLRVGVSGDTLLFGSRNPFTTELEGVDIDVLREIARALFGEDGDERIEFRVITYADRLPRLESGDVDVVAHTMTITCSRWQRIAFSSVYYWAGQSVLVDRGSGYTGIDDFDPDELGGVVCAPNGSTNIDLMARAYPEVEVIGKDDISDCLVAMQQGEADATTGDDTVLAGFAAQDPNTVVVGEPFSDEPYGLGFNEDDVDLVRFANAVLDDMRTDGRLDAIVRRWLLDTGALPQVIPVPQPDHSRPLP